MLVAAVAGTGCGESGASDQSPAPWVATNDPATTFAPLVQLHAAERSYPMSARRFLRSSGLEFVGNSCAFVELDIAAGPISRPLVGQPVPAMSSYKLAHEPSYRTRAVGTDCEYRDDVYSATQRTRPFDVDDRPAGLRIDEGFNLDILTEEQPGKRRLADDGSLAGVPVYVHTSHEQVDGGAGLRLSYWLLFGRGEAYDPTSGKIVNHEGDWERVDVLVAKRGRSSRYRPARVEYRARKALRPWHWSDVEKDATGQHPVVYLARADHTPYPRPSRTREPRRLPWKTWRRVRDVTREPWYGYGGGWGAFGYTEAGTGPLGPSPFELRAPQPSADAD